MFSYLFLTIFRIPNKIIFIFSSSSSSSSRQHDSAGLALDWDFDDQDALGDSFDSDEFDEIFGQLLAFSSRPNDANQDFGVERLRLEFVFYLLFF